MSRRLVPVQNFSVTSPAFATTLQHEFPEVEKTARVVGEVDIGKRVTTSFTEWRNTVKTWLKKQGIESRRAGVLSHWLVDSAAGLHFGFLISGDRNGTVQAFDVFLTAFLREAFGD